MVHDLLCQILTTFHLYSINKCQEQNFHYSFKNPKTFLPQLYLFVFLEWNKVVGNIIDASCKEFPANIKPFCLELLAKGCIVNTKLKQQEFGVFVFLHLSCSSCGICARWPLLEKRKSKVSTSLHPLECKHLFCNIQNEECWFCGSRWMPVSETITPMDHLRQSWLSVKNFCPCALAGGPILAPSALLYSCIWADLL